MTENKIYVIGIGFRPLDNESRRILSAADVILASDRLMDVFRRYREYEEVGEKVLVIKTVGETMDFMERNREERSIVLLASGDPMFHGIGRRVVTLFGRENVEIVPDLSSIQTAFSRIGHTWDDAFLMSLHQGLVAAKGAPDYTLDDLPSLLEAHRKVAILTDDVCNPPAISRVFAVLPQCPPMRVFVCEKLGYGPEERITEGTPEEIASGTFAEPNVVILVREGRDPASREEHHPGSDGISSQAPEE